MSCQCAQAASACNLWLAPQPLWWWDLLWMGVGRVCVGMFGHLLRSETLSSTHTHPHTHSHAHDNQREVAPPLFPRWLA